MIENMVKISFITFTKNSSERIQRLLENVRDVVDEIIVIDGFSTDETVEIARSYGARVYQRKPWGYADPDRMFGVKMASYDWILSLDDDEILGSKLRNELRSIISSLEEDVSAISVTRINLVGNNRILLGPFYPDRGIRVFRKDKVIFTGIVHSGPIISGKIYNLPEEYYVLHFGSNWTRKMILYAYLQSRQYYKLPKGRKMRSILFQLLPFTTIPYYIYFVVGLMLRKVPFNSITLPFIWERILYESILNILMITRSKKERQIAKLISEKGLIQLLKLDTKSY